MIYAGSGAVDRSPIRMEFLWLRWYEQVDAARTGWAAQRLDRLRFPPLANEDSFGFLDPADVLRGCHIVPVFWKGRRHADGCGLSSHSKDKTDWAEYYVNRCVLSIQ